MRARCDLWALVPVKPFSEAKSRLASALSPAERADLAEAMFRDVLAAIGKSGCFAGIAVVTRCPRAAAIARSAGARVVSEGDDVAGGTGAAVRRGLAALGGAGGVMVLVADMPLLNADDVRAVAQAHDCGPAMTIVPALDGGTTILALSPPHLIRPAFGEDSFGHHLALAAMAGVAPQIVRPAGAVADLDRPEDLALLGGCSPYSHTGIAARKLGIAQDPSLCRPRDAGRPSFRPQAVPNGSIFR